MKCKHEWIFRAVEELGLGEYFYCNKCLAEAFVTESSRHVTITEATNAEGH